MTEYFTITGQQKNGPYDLITMVRKIRTGVLLPDTLIQQSEADIPKPAKEWPDIAEFFITKEEWAEPSEAINLKNINLILMIKNGWRFLQRNQVSTVFSGLFILISIIFSGLIYFFLPQFIHPVAFMLCFVIMHSLLSCYLFILLRMARGQPFDMHYILGKVLPVFPTIFISSLLASLPAMCGVALFIYGDETLGTIMAGLMILAVPGLFAITVFIFTPFLIIDQKYGFREAMKKSCEALFKNGVENAGIIFSLLVINFIAGLFALLPMVITLPITLSGIAEIYDEMFSS